MVEELKDYGNAEKSPMQEGRQIVVLINPKS
jgi:translation initiation factor IF-3